MDDLVCKMSRKELMDSFVETRTWLLQLKQRTPHRWLKKEIDTLLEIKNES